MKIIMIQYDNLVDVSTLTKGSVATVNGVNNGKIIAIVDSIDSSILPHYHEGGSTGPAIPASNV